MIFIYLVICGVLFYLADLTFAKFFKKSIIQWIDDTINRIGGENLDNLWAKVILRVFIILGVPFGFFYISTILPKDSFGFWVFTILGVVFFGYAGILWLDSSSFSFPSPKVIKRVIVLLAIAFVLLFILTRMQS